MEKESAYSPLQCQSEELTVETTLSPHQRPIELLSATPEREKEANPVFFIPGWS